MGPITFVDVALGVVVLVSALIGMARGLVREVLGAFAWIGALLATLFGFNGVRPFAREIVGNIPYRDVAGDALAGAGIFLVVLIILSLISNAISSMVRDSALSSIDRTLGLVFGFLRGAVLLVLAYAAWQMVWSGPAPSWMNGARAMPFLEAGADILRRIVPAGTVQGLGIPVNDKRDQIEKIIEGGRALQQMQQPAAAAPSAVPGAAATPLGAGTPTPIPTPSAQPAPAIPVQSAPLPATPAQPSPPPVGRNGAGGTPSVGQPAPTQASPVPPPIARPSSQPAPATPAAPAAPAAGQDRDALDRLIRGKQ